MMDRWWGTPSLLFEPLASSGTKSQARALGNWMKFVLVLHTLAFLWAWLPLGILRLANKLAGSDQILYLLLNEGLILSRVGSVRFTSTRMEKARKKTSLGQMLPLLLQIKFWMYVLPSGYLSQDLFSFCCVNLVAAPYLVWQFSFLERPDLQGSLFKLLVYF